MRQLEAYFKGLSDSTRLRIMNLLLNGELCVCDIQRVLNASQPNISRHLNYLKHSGLVSDHRDGLRVFYRIREEESETLSGLCGYLREGFKGDGILEADLRQLRGAIEKGVCAVPPANPSREKSGQEMTQG